MGRAPNSSPPSRHRGGHGDGVDVSEQRYEVMYFVDLLDERIQEFKEAWGEIGDSIVVVGGDGLWNCHVHTNDIGAAVEVALEVGGRPGRSGSPICSRRWPTSTPPRAGNDGRSCRSSGRRPGLPPVTCAVVAVASGDGLAELFGQLGVQGVVTGGQTLNPSTAELLAAVEAVNADQVVVLPNNKNIIPVAEQLDALTTKSVRVVPTTSMPAALAALVVYDPEADADVNLEEMTDAAQSVATGEVTQAVRDTNSDVGAITAGDWIGLVRGDGIVSVSGRSRRHVALLEHLVTPGPRDRHHVIEGAGVTAGHTDVTRAWAGRAPSRRAGRGAPRRPAAVPVPLRR